jgi:hypothetical protein
MKYPTIHKPNQFVYFFSCCFCMCQYICIFLCNIRSPLDAKMITYSCLFASSFMGFGRSYFSAHTCQIKMSKSSSNEHLYIFQVALFNQAEFVLLMDIGVNIQRKDSQVFYYIWAHFVMELMLTQYLLNYSTLICSWS